MNVRESARLWLAIAATVLLSVACTTQETRPVANATPQSETMNNESLLSAYHWLLPASVSGVEAPVQLTFHDNQLSMTGLCNALGASYTVKGTAMQVGNVISTMKMCADNNVMLAEQRLGKRLPDVTSWHISNATDENSPILTLTFSDTEKWTLSGDPTNETRYGSTAETVFLEVQPQRVACQHGAAGNHQCLVVRTISYDEAGLKRSQGEWQNFYGEIDGYTHEPGVRNVLRLKRYTRENRPADASRFVYVLDMVVESENLKPR